MSRAGSLAADGFAPTDPVRQARKTQRFRWLRTMPFIIRICALILLGFVLVALAAPVLAPVDPADQDLLGRLQPPVGFGGSWDHPLGTDQLGRDVLSRTLYGARVSLGVGLAGLVIGVTLGVLCGLIAGVRPGLVDDGLMFLVDVQLALPFIVIALIAIALFGSTLTVLIIVMGFAGWESYARLTRGMVLGTRKSQYVLAAEALGASSTRIISRHIMPNVIAPVIVLATFLLTGLILLESTLSFLGIGVQPPTPSWGSMIGEGRDYLNTAWWMAVIPGVAIMLATMSISLLGDWLRDVLDPTVRSR
ncbi:MAG: ABC transporter permease [Thermomicrobiales bacterium]